MPSIKSQDIRRALMGKMKAEEDKRRDDPFYTIEDENGRIVATTSISHGANEPLGRGRVSKMAGQLHLDDAHQLVDLVNCPLSREKALAIMQRSWPPGSSRLMR